MRLGSFWGITAPMLVIATKQNGMESILPMLNVVSTNKEIITDLKAELIYLLRVVDKIPKSTFLLIISLQLKTLTKAFGMLMENSMQKELTSKTST